jgi:hypothetical protein
VADLHLVVSPDAAALLEHAADGFLTPRAGSRGDPFPTPPYLLVLRQGGVRDDVLALAAARGVPGWFDPPLCVFAELPEWLGRTARQPCGEFERVVLVTAVLRRAARHVFPRQRHPEDFADAVDRLFGELASEGVTPDDYDRAVARLGARDEFERGRDADLAAAYRLYHAELAAGRRRPRDDGAGFRDGRDTLVDCAAALSADPAGFAGRLGGRREIRVFGLADLRGGWRVLLRALAASPVLDRVVLYAAHPLDLDPTLSCHTTALPDAGAVPVAMRLFTDAGGPREAGDPAGRAHLISAPDAEREVEEVARRVRLLAEQGVALPRIAVVVRQARPYLDLVVRALERAGVPATARRRVSYREIPVLRSLFALLDAAAEGWSRHGLVELAEQPYFANDLNGRILNFAGYRARITGLSGWATALAELEREAGRREAAPDDGEERRPPLPSRRRLEAAVAGFARFADVARALDGERPLRAWVEWLRRFVADDPWDVERRVYDVPDRRFDVARVDLRGWKDLGQSVDEWSAALERWSGGGVGEERLAAGAFRARLAELLAGDAALWTPVQRGVRVLEGLAAAYRRFEHVFLVGLTAGKFPVRPPLSPVLDESDRDALAAAGLPLESRDAWERRERELFRMIVAASGAPVTASYARLDASGWEVVRSAFVDALVEAAQCDEDVIATHRVVTPGLPLYASPDLAAHAERVARIELSRRAGLPSPHNGLIEDPELRAALAREFGDERVWSATQLEAYAKCPWAFFSGRLLRLDKREEPDDELDPATRGVVLHDALARFFAAAQERLGGPVLLREADVEWAGPLARTALDEALAAAGGETWMGHPAFREAKHDELHRLLREYLAFEVDHNEKLFNTRSKNVALLRTAVAAHEWTFDDAALERDGVRVRYRGAIDRVEVNVDERAPAEPFVAAVDYKSSKGGVPGGGDPAAWDDGVVLQLPLYAHALAALREGARVARVQYRTLRDPQVAHSLELYKMDRRAGALHPDAEGRERLDRALDAVTRHVRAARDGRFPAAPAPSCGCPPFCHAWDVCRVRGGPRAKRDP